MHLFIVRHAWAYKQDALRWPDDRQRPLTLEGIERFERVAKRLVAAGCEPGVIATSPLVRCVQTAEILARHVPGSPKVEELPALRPGSDLAALVAWTKEQSTEAVAWVGHAPDVGYLTSAMIGDARAEIHFAKGTCAAIRFGKACRICEGELRWLATADVLGC